jgi:hypothetical protein
MNKKFEEIYQLMLNGGKIKIVSDREVNGKRFIQILILYKGISGVYHIPFTNSIRYDLE